MKTQAIEELRTVRDWLRWSWSRFESAGLFYGHGTDNALDEARFLVLAGLGLPFGADDWVLDARLDRDERNHLARLVERRIRQRVPAPYLVGEAWFAGLPFRVDRSVLIPRSPIAELIESGFRPWLAPDRPLRILDLCCGSGCIGIACAVYLDVDCVDLADVSAAALAVARDNLRRHGLEDQVDVVESDLFDGLAGRQYDLIVCNPPYVDAADMASLPPEYRHEPRQALAAGDDGLDLVRRILAEARQFLSPDGILVCEVGNSAPALEAAFPELPFLWLDFERGGHGVFLLTAAQLTPDRPAQGSSDD
jgi:ribosomal protein L3 glutamine methyltransferase